jgi:hypothetical protein
MPETSITPPAVSRPSKPVSEALLNEKVSCLPPNSGSPELEACLVDAMLISNREIVGSLPLLPPDPLHTRSLLRRRIFSPSIQTEGMASVCRPWFRSWKGI